MDCYEKKYFILSRPTQLHLLPCLNRQIYDIGDLQIFHRFIAINRNRRLFAIKYNVEKRVHLHGLMGGNGLIKFAFTILANTGVRLTCDISL